MALINLRNALMAGKHKPTAKDYVQNGLVAMWDGIENAGWGVHDANATVWKDLAGEVDVNVNVSFSNNALICPGNIAPCVASSYISVAQTIEVVFKHDDDKDFFLIYSKGKPSLSKGFLVATWKGALGFDNTITRVIYAGRNRVAVSATSKSGTDNFVTSEIYVDGIESSSSSNDYWRDDFAGTLIGSRTRNSATYIFNGEIYSIRLYSRVLTVSEIAANYAIDKARFHLP